MYEFNGQILSQGLLIAFINFDMNTRMVLRQGDTCDLSREETNSCVDYLN